jgi:hypothetical protein
MRAVLTFVAVVIVGIYVIPSFTASFSGGHTIELNKTGGLPALKCLACHQYIQDELTSTSATQLVLQAHSDAAGNSSYTSRWLTSKINNQTNNQVCLLCHIAELTIAGSHTQSIVRTCIDVDCHGNANITNNTAYPTAGSVGPKLGNTSNVHGRWFAGISEYPSKYFNETGAYYSKGYLACLGCHTEVNLDLNITQGSFPHDNPSAERRRYL